MHYYSIVAISVNQTSHAAALCQALQRLVAQQVLLLFLLLLFLLFF
jgi:hypothetical protein